MRRLVCIRLRDRIIKALDRLAEENDVTRTLLIKRAIELFLKSEEADFIYEKVSKSVMKTGFGRKRRYDKKSEGVLILTRR